MSLVSHAMQRINCECSVQTCRKGNCSLKLNDLPENALLIDMDHESAPISSQSEKKCDYIFIGDDKGEAWVAPLELKGGKFSASDVIEQLQAGANVANSIVPFDSQTRFRPIVAHGRGIHRAELKKLQMRRVNYRNQSYLIGKVRCGSSLLKALKKA